MGHQPVGTGFGTVKRQNFRFLAHWIGFFSEKLLVSQSENGCKLVKQWTEHKSKSILNRFCLIHTE